MSLCCTRHLSPCKAGGNGSRVYDTGRVDEAKLEQALHDVMDLSPRGIRQHLDLNKPIYARTSAYGHFGRKPDDEGGFSWEKDDLAETLKSAVS